MVFPQYPASRSVGAHWFTVNATTVKYPTDRVGGSDASTGVVDTTERHIIVEGALRLTGTTSALRLTDGAGTQIGAHDWTMPSAGNYVSFGREGIEILNQGVGGIGGRTDTGTDTLLVFYRVVNPA